MHLSCEKKKSQCRLCRALCTYWHSSQHSETMLGSHLDSHLSTKSLTPESTSALEFFFLPQTIGLYSHFEQTPRSQKAQDKLSTLSKEYFNWAFWNLFARIQEKLIKESLPENKTVLREEKIKAAWRESTSFWANSEVQCGAKALTLPSKSPNHRKFWGGFIQAHNFIQEALETGILSCVWKVSTCNQRNKHQSSPWP